MSVMQHAWLGNYEVSSTTCTGLTFARHSHDECVIGANLVGEEKVWLDRREFDAGPGSITVYNPGQIQGGGAADGAPWQFVSLYATADQLAAYLGLAYLEFDRSQCFQPDLAQRLADAVKGALSSDALVRERYEEALVLLLAEVVKLSGVRSLIDAWRLPEPGDAPASSSQNALAVGAAISLANPKNSVYWGALGSALSGIVGATPSHGQTLMFFAGFMLASVLSCFLIAALVNLLRQNASPTWQRISYALCGWVLICLAILAALGI